MTKIRFAVALLLCSLIAALGITVAPSVIAPKQAAPSASAAQVNCYPNNPKHTYKYRTTQARFTYHTNRLRLDWYKCYDGHGGYEITYNLNVGYLNTGDSGPCQAGFMDGYWFNPEDYNGNNQPRKWVPCAGESEYRNIPMHASTLGENCLTVYVEAVWEGIIQNKKFEMTVCTP